MALEPFVSLRALSRRTFLSCRSRSSFGRCPRAGPPMPSSSPRRTSSTSSTPRPATSASMLPSTRRVGATSASEGPTGQRFKVQPEGNLKEIGLTELFLEGEEPSLDEVPFARFRSLFPEGDYVFAARTTERPGAAERGPADRRAAVPGHGGFARRGASGYARQGRRRLATRAGRLRPGHEEVRHRRGGRAGRLPGHRSARERRGGPEARVPGRPASRGDSRCRSRRSSSRRVRAWRAPSSRSRCWRSRTAATKRSRRRASKQSSPCPLCSHAAHGRPFTAAAALQ